ncbi:ABC transporter permease [Arenivirga flava]|uniref:Osmoprotectant (Glycine betaine/ carnitine/choline/l-proline) ABC transporter ProW n=1 Tax=Arenivirga flava TaxID=1930060 RepID=A0AA37XAP0_9MICO|nr:ABC transporter permease [Arenivirga flava]GMA26927.1 putative osmoprotectant (glycine betaine/ carnitine/choline/l-proline) ABC transporter ProW [Arenivirga flava]
MNWVLDNLDLIGRLSLDHLRLSVVPIVLGFVIAIPLGWVAWRLRITGAVLLTLAGLLYTIPSIALIVALPAIIGTSLLSESNVTIALTLYAVAIMARSVAEALGSVDAGTRQAAVAMGYSSWRRFWGVDFPLAGPVLLAGLRVVAVSTIALVTVGALVGIDSLGYLFTNGYQRRIIPEILAGLVVTMALALIVDGLLVLIGRVLMPWTRGQRAATTTLAPKGVDAA